MELSAALTLAKTFGPWVLGALAAAALGLLVLDRNHLASLNDQHTACLAAVEQQTNAKPIASVCEAPIAAASEASLASAACNQALAKGDAFAASQACQPPTKDLIAQRDSDASEVANLNGQLGQAQATQTAAVARAEARASAAAQGLSHAQSLLAAQPHDADGMSVCDAVCLRGLAAPAGGAPAHP